MQDRRGPFVVSDVGLFLRWSAANTGAALVGSATLLMLPQLGPPWIHRAGLLVWWLGAGVLFGSAQWLVFRKRWRMSRWWIPVASMVGVFTPLIWFWIADLSWRILGTLIAGLLAGAIAGAVVGGVQLVLLDPPPQRRIPWILASAVAVTLAPLAAPNPFLPAALPGFILSGGLSGAIYGAITGVIFIVFPPPQHPPAPSNVLL